MPSVQADDAAITVMQATTAVALLSANEYNECVRSMQRLSVGSVAYIEQLVTLCKLVQDALGAAYDEAVDQQDSSSVYRLNRALQSMRA